jgi:glycosyltransferase involved in cell wall biosynthesis
LEDLRDNYNSCGLFVNTSTYSPIPMSLLEAMSCGCAVVSTATCAIPEIIENGVNGFATNDISEMKEYISAILKDEKLRDSLGKEARKTILNKFSIKRFASEWNEIFYEVVNNA